MTPRQVVILSAACIAVGIAILLAILAYIKRHNRRTGEADLPVKDDLREMKMWIEELSELLSRAEATIVDLRDVPAGAGPPGLRRNRDTDPDRTDEIVRLCETGIDVLEIARRLDVPTGEVELVLNLHRRGKTGAAARQ